MNFFIVLTTFVLIATLIKIKSKQPTTFYFVALAAASAHIALNVYGVQYLVGWNANAWLHFLPDFLIRIAVLLWLWYRPNAWAAGLIAAYTTWSLLSGLRADNASDPDNLLSLAVHAAVLTGLGYRYLLHRRSRQPTSFDAHGDA